MKKIILLTLALLTCAVTVNAQDIISGIAILGSAILNHKRSKAEPIETRAPVKVAQDTKPELDVNVWTFNFPHQEPGVKPDSTFVIRAIQYASTPSNIRQDINVLLRGSIRIGESEQVHGLQYRKLPDLYYTVIEYPDKGVYYGFAQIRGVNPSWDNLELMAGRFITTKGDTIPVIYDIDACLTPKEISGTYRSNIVDMASTYDYYTKEADGGVASRWYTGIFTFNKGGTGVVKYGREFTEDTPQVTGAEFTKYTKGKGYKNVRQLTGGWPFDIDAKATMNMKWKVMDGDLYVRSTSKPTFAATTTLNTDKIINGWKEEDADRQFEFKMDTYRRQYLAQCKGDYPNFMVSNLKATVLKDLKEVCHLPNDVAFRIVGVGENDIFALPYKSDNLERLIQFQKKKGATPLIDLDDLNYCISIYKQKIWPNLMDEIAGLRTHELMSYKTIKCGEVVSMYADFETENMDYDNAAVILLATTEGQERPACYATIAKFNGQFSQLDRGAFEDNLSQINDLENLEKKIAENDILFKNYTSDKKYKNAKKCAKDFLSQYKKQKRTFEYNTVIEYFKAVKSAEEFLKIQEQHLSQCQQAL